MDMKFPINEYKKKHPASDVKTATVHNNESPEPLL